MTTNRRRFFSIAAASAVSSLLFKMPNRLLTLILLACGERASSVFALGGGDPLRSAFATAFLDEFARA